MATWTVFGRQRDLQLDDALPIASLQLVLKHLEVSTGIVQTPYTPEVWARTGPGFGVVVRRDDVVQLTGQIVSQQLDTDDEGRAVIKLLVQGDERRLARRIVFPDPTRAGDAQSTLDYWTATATPSAAMLRLISDQAGPLALPANRIPSLIIGPDPGVGAVQPWQFRYDNLLVALAAMSLRSGANLGVRVTSTVDGLLAGLAVPRDVAGDVRFSTGLGNLAAVSYSRTAPDVTTAIAAGGGDLKLRLQQQVVSTDPDDAAWLDPGWAYVDRRDTTDTAELLKAAADAIADGQGTESVALTLTDTDAARFGVAWGLGDRVTVHVGIGDTGTVATIVDSVREVRIDVDSDGAQTIRPAVGTPDATVGPPSLTRRQLADLGQRLSLLERRK